MEYPHTWYKCAPECWGCQFCLGGLAQCTVCGAGEGELLPDCPGFQLSPEAREACFRGNVAALTMWRAYKLAGLVRRGRRWVAK